MRASSQVALVVKSLPGNAGDKRLRFDLWVGKIPWRRARQPTLVFLPGASHGQSSLSGYRIHRISESDTTEATACTHTNNYDKPDCSDCLLGNFQVLVSYSSCLLFEH